MCCFVLFVDVIVCGCDVLCVVAVFCCVLMCADLLCHDMLVVCVELRVRCFVMIVLICC